MSNMTNPSKYVDKETISMLRTIHQKQVQLVSLADQKANMLMGILVIGLSIVATNLYTYKSEINSLMTTALIFLFSLLELISIFFAIWVIAPRIKFDKGTIDISKSKNPLFFMESSGTNEDTYVSYMLKQFKSPKRVYELLLIDFYQIGTVLKEKYKYLSLAYLSAVLGLIPAIFLLVIIFTCK